MKVPILLLCSIGIVSANMYNETGFPTDVDVEHLSTISSSFTDASRYNTWDHAGIPLGILETETAVTSLDIGYRRLNWTNKANTDSTRIFNGINLPVIRVGAPGKVFLDLNYKLNPITVMDEGDEAGMTFSRFGLSVVAQVEDGRFMIGLGGQGYYGKEKWDVNGHQRILMGGEDVGLCIGFRLHDAVVMNIYGRAAGYVDTLYRDPPESMDYPQERFSWFQLPQITAALDIGMDDLPYRSNFCFTYAHNSFVYTAKITENVPSFIKYITFVDDDNDSALTEYNNGGDFDPLVSDSIAWHWQNNWDVEVTDAFRFHPAAQFGYWHSRFKHMQPNGDNFPINYNGERPGWEWDSKSLRFGLGGAWSYEELIRFWVEYTYTNLKLELTGEKLEHFKQDLPDNNNYHRMGVGFKTDFARIPYFEAPQSLGIYLRVGFLFMQQNQLTATFRSEPFARMYPILGNIEDMSTVDDVLEDLNVELNRYQPWVTIKNELYTMGLTIGLGASFMDKMVETGLHFGILRQTYTRGREDEYKGFEFGFDVVYNTFGDKKSSSSIKAEKPEQPSRPQMKPLPAEEEYSPEQYEE